MKVQVPKSAKEIKIDKTNSSALAIVAVSVAIVVFCLFSAKALLTQGAYQRRVVNAKQDTVEQLETNIESAKTLTSQYDVFEKANPNAIGGKSDVPDNAVPPDGKNSRIVLDALPISYDFPALISSLNKLLDLNRMENKSIGGSDQGMSFTSDPSGNPQPVTIQAIPLSGTSNSGRIKNLLLDLERSTRPYDVTSMQINGSNSNMTLVLNLNTYYQPAKKIILEDKEVK